MRKMIVIATLLSFCVCASAATKNFKPQPQSTGIVIATLFYFYIEGDGISTTFTFNPRRVPPVYINFMANLPHLPLVGVDNSGARCGGGGSDEPSTGTLSKGLLTVNFTTAPPANVYQQCTLTLLFQPE